MPKLKTKITYFAIFNNYMHAVNGPGPRVAIYDRCADIAEQCLIQRNKDMLNLMPCEMFHTFIYWQA